MKDLVRLLQQNISDVEIDNDDATWKAPVLQSGLQLARKVLDTFDVNRHKRIILIGHSQGGLLSRVAAAAICDPNFSTILSTRGYKLDPDDWPDSYQQLARTTSPYLKGVITLATPNAGAFTFGQLSLSGRLVLKAKTKLAGLLGVHDIADLTTDRLFRFLQHLRVPDVHYLSISGSIVSRYSKANHDDLAMIPLVSRLGIHLEKPNDGIVEDCSVDLSQAPLPSEIYDPANQYEHIRVYRDCIDVSHVNIHSNNTVVEMIRDRIAQW